MVAEGDGEAAVALLQRRLDQVDRGGPDEAGDELVDRPVVERLRGVDLLQAPAVHHRDAVAHRHRLDLVVRDVDRRHIEPPLQLVDLGAHLHPQLRIEVRERLVHQEGLRLADDRAPHGDALTLAARESARLALEEVLDLEDARRALDPLLDFLLRQLVELEAEGEVLLDGHVRIERVALEHHRDVALLRRQVVDDAVADPDLAVSDLLEARNHAQGGRLAAAGGADENHQLAILDGETEVEDGLRAVVVDLLNIAELDLGHSRWQLTPVHGRRQHPGQSKSQMKREWPKLLTLCGARVSHRFAGRGQAICWIMDTQKQANGTFRSHRSSGCRGTVVVSGRTKGTGNSTKEGFS